MRTEKASVLSPRHGAALALLAGLAGLGQHFGIPLSLGEPWLFGSAAVLVAARLVGPLAAALVTLPVAALQWGGALFPLSWATLLLEGMAVGYALRRCPGEASCAGRLLWADALFWLLAGPAAALLRASLDPDLDRAAASTLALLHGANGLANALLAALAVTLLHAFGRRRAARWHLRDLVVPSLLAGMFLPALLLTLHHGALGARSLEPGPLHAIYRSGFSLSLAAGAAALLFAAAVGAGLARHLRRLALHAAALPGQPADAADRGGTVEGAVLELREPAAAMAAAARRLRAVNAEWEAALAARAAALDEALREQRQTQARLSLSHRIVENTAEGVIVTDPDGRIEYVNPAFSRVTGYPAPEVLGRTPALLRSGRHDTAFYQAMWRALGEHGRWRGEIWNRRRDGAVYPAWLDIGSIRAADGRVQHYVGIFSDISAQEEAKRRIHHLAYYDALTGLPNRALLRDRLEQGVRLAQRSGEGCALLFIDLDRFKSVNDGFGHGHGDALLKAAAERLRGALRESDTVARVGGDEFVVLLPAQPRTREAALHVARHLLAAFEAPFPLAGTELYVSLSIGIGLYPEDAADPDELLRRADAALNRAKAEGRNGYRLFTAGDGGEADRLTLESELRTALRQEALQLHYQPQVDLRTGRLTGFEALVRWPHPQRGVIGPDRFIPLAEESGLIVPLGEWVLRTACRQQRAWREAGFPELRMAVNLSPRQIANPEQAERITRILQQEAVDPRLLELEITEGLFLDQGNPHVPALLARWQALGVELAIDDFGTGYSALGYLKHFPIRTVKVDRSFVRDIISDPENAAIVNALLAMARALGLRVVAEGVETEHQMRFLRRRGCDEAQGYLFAAPAPPQGADAWLRANSFVVEDGDEADQQTPTVLVAAPEAGDRAALAQLLSLHGYRVLVTASAEGAFEQLALTPVHVVLAEQRLGPGSGVDLLEAVRRLYPPVVRVLVTADADPAALAAAVNRGRIHRFVTRPWCEPELLGLVEEAFAQYEELLWRRGT